MKSEILNRMLSKLVFLREYLTNVRELGIHKLSSDHLLGNSYSIGPTAYIKIGGIQNCIELYLVIFNTAVCKDASLVSVPLEITRDCVYRKCIITKVMELLSVHAYCESHIRIHNISNRLF